MLWKFHVCVAADNFFEICPFDAKLGKKDMSHHDGEFHHSFLYWRQSPRGMVKFGITHLPWERLRMQQQGTDECIQFDHLWMIRSLYPSYVKLLETRLKQHYQSQCLHNTTKRAGHTEWYTDINIADFRRVLSRNLAKLDYGVSEVKKIPLKQPYTATKSSECPLGSPTNSRHQTVPIHSWAKRFWYKISDLNLVTPPL
jgi:hypothetical protein